MIWPIHINDRLDTLEYLFELLRLVPEFTEVYNAQFQELHLLLLDFDYRKSQYICTRINAQDTMSIFFFAQWKDIK